MADTSPRNRSGPMDVYSVMLVVAAILLGVGCTVLALHNTEASSVDGAAGGPFVMVGK